MINFDDLEEKNGLYYEVNSKLPFNGKVAGPWVTEPSVRIKVDPQHSSTPVMFVASTDTSAQLFPESYVQCLSKALNSSFETR